MNKLIQQSIVSSLSMLRRSIYLVLGFFDANVLKRTNMVSVLSYHSVAEDDWRFSIDSNMLRKQIDFLKFHYDFITLKDLESFTKNKKEITRPSIILTFDDGYRDILKLKNYFAAQNIKPVLFILADSLNANWKELGSRRRPLLSKKDILSLINEGWEIGSHTSTHPNLSQLSSEDLKYEIAGSKRKLENDLGIGIKYFAYPRGKYNQKVLECVKKAGYEMALTMDDGVISIDTDPLLIPRIGVDRTHSFAEFKTLFSPLNIDFRKLVKTSFVGRYI